MPEAACRACGAVMRYRNQRGFRLYETSCPSCGEVGRLASGLSGLRDTGSRILAAWERYTQTDWDAEDEGDGEGEGKAFDDVVAELSHLREWGCRA